MVHCFFIGLSLLILTACTGRPTPTPTLMPSPTPVTTDTLALGGHVFGFTSPDLMRDANMTWVKFQVVFHRGDAPAVVTPLLDQARAQNLKVLLSIKGVPAEVSAADYKTEFAAFVGGVAALKPDAVEVWNEQNIEREWPAGQINGTQYTNLLKLAYPAIKTANPETLVIGGAPAPTGFFSGQCTANGCDDDLFLRQMAAAGAVDFMDCVGIHYNEGILPPDARSGDPRGNSGHYSRYFPAMVDVYTQVFPSKPLCFTEIGYLSADGYGALPAGFEWAEGITIQKQADWLSAALRLARQSRRVSLFVVWNVDSTTYDADPQAGYAIVRRNGTCPACLALAGALNN